MKQPPLILSLLYQDTIEKVCTPLSKIGLKYFVCYMVFNNGQAFVLSNMFHMLSSYYNEEYYKQDYSFRPEITIDTTHYLCDATIATTKEFQNILENRFGIYRSYYIIRNSPECQFIFGAIKGHKSDNNQNFYKKTLEPFEDFCCHFVDNTINIIKRYNPTYYSALILNDANYRKSIIKSNKKEKLTARELECLYMAANGKSSDETASLLNISKATIESYRNEARRKLSAVNITNAVFEAIKHGYIGAFQQRWEKGDNTANISVVNNMQEAEKVIKNTNLWLINTKI